MIDLLLGGIEPPKPPLIQVVVESSIEQPIELPRELTIEEKIASNYYQCDESVEWIRADTAGCLPKRLEYRASESANATEPVLVPTTVKNTATAPAGWFPKYQCTWHVWTKRPTGRWNDASEWLWQAKRDGYATSTTPRVGAIAWEYGHVSYVEAVDGDRVYISERNYDNKGSYRESWQPASKYTYIY